MRKSEQNGPVLEPLSEPVQRAEGVYQALLNGIIRGEFNWGAQLFADAIAQQLRVSTTPVRDALNRLEKDDLVVKQPYQGWFVRRFQEQEVRDVYEMRAGLECFSVRLACERITPAEIAWLRAHQATGEAALARQDLEAYRLYNQELHAAIMRAAKNSQLAQVMGQISLKTQMLSAKTIRLGRGSRAVQEHRRLIELIAKREVAPAQELMQQHLFSALEDILRHGVG
jgi:DNA-binding GntR family transcriptional regulator